MNTMIKSNSRVEAVAKIAHEINRAYCLTIGDASQPIWEDAPDWQRDSAIAGVKFVIEAEDPQPGESHRSWLRQKEVDGWVWGPRKDPEKKQHPCMVPFEKLPSTQQVKDYLFIAAVQSAWEALSND